MKKGGGTLLFLLVSSSLMAAPPLRITGSSSVFPFAATVAEHFSYKTHEPPPLVEAFGTGAGIKLFCQSPGAPDGVMTSRPMTSGEKKNCEAEGVQFEEIKIGQDGLVFILKRPEMSLNFEKLDLRRMLAEKVSLKGQCQQNPFTLWSQIEARLPPHPLRILGPAPTSGTYEVLVDKIKGVCGEALRRDGIYIEAPANENLIVQKVLTSPHTFGIVTFGFYEQNQDKVRAVEIEGVEPSFQSIQQGTYPLSRPLYLYVKLNDLSQSPARIAYAQEFLSEASSGPQGYLNEKGLIPLSEEERDQIRERLMDLVRKDIP